MKSSTRNQVRHFLVIEIDGADSAGIGNTRDLIPSAVSGAQVIEDWKSRLTPEIPEFTIEVGEASRLAREHDTGRIGGQILFTAIIEMPRDQHDDLLRREADLVGGGGAPPLWERVVAETFSEEADIVERISRIETVLLTPETALVEIAVPMNELEDALAWYEHD